MFVSFVIPMYNCEAYVQSCVERILHCGLPRQEFEIIMVDDGSRDGKYLENSRLVIRKGDRRYSTEGIPVQ